jgi:hypothetical protein
VRCVTKPCPATADASLRLPWAVIGLVLFTSWAQAEDNQPQWQAAKSKDGVAVFTALMPDSRFLAFKAVTVMDAKLDVIVMEIADYEAYPQWYYNIKETELVELPDSGEAIVRITIKAPFPFANRDAVNQVAIESHNDTMLIHLVSQPERVAAKDRIVRMSKASGSWLLEPHAEGTRVTHTYHADPKIRVPSWIMKRYVVDGPIKTLTNLRQRVED